jgi:hypothetical protein
VHTKLPTPSKDDVIEWVKFAYDNICPEKIRKTFRLIGFIPPIDHMEDDYSDHVHEDYLTVDSTIVSQSIVLNETNVNMNDMKSNA